MNADEGEDAMSSVCFTPLVTAEVTNVMDNCTLHALLRIFLYCTVPRRLCKKFHCSEWALFGQRRDVIGSSERLKMMGNRL